MKIRTLSKNIQEGNIELALELCEELFNDLRDFSQCIDIVELEDGSINIEMNRYTEGARTKELKRKIQAWVGGH